SCLRARGGPSFRRIRADEVLGGKERGMTGTHRDPGLLISSQPVNLPQPGLEDIAPTVLSVLGVDAPPMDGATLWGRPPDRQNFAAIAAPSPYSAAEEALIESRLRALGYLE